MSWNAAYALLLFLSTFITWVTGLLVDLSPDAKTVSAPDAKNLTASDTKALKHGKAGKGGKGSSATKNSPVVKKTKDGFDRRKLILAAGVILNLSILGYFKYFKTRFKNRNSRKAKCRKVVPCKCSHEAEQGHRIADSRHYERHYRYSFHVQGQGVYPYRYRRAQKEEQGARFDRKVQRHQSGRRGRAL